MPAHPAKFAASWGGPLVVLERLRLRKLAGLEGVQVDAHWQPSREHTGSGSGGGSGQKMKRGSLLTGKSIFLVFYFDCI